MNLWMIIALLLIAALAAYAGYLHWLLWQKKRREAHPTGPASISGGTPSDSAALVEPQPQQRLVVAEKAIYLLAEGLLDDKLTHTEGCIRIVSMSAGLPDYQQFQVEYGVFFKVAEATAHIPILDSWRALSIAEKTAFDRERQVIEERYETAVKEAAQRLRERWKRTAS